MKHLTISMTNRETRFGWICLLVQLFCLPSLLSLGNQLLAAPLSESLINFLYFTLSFCLILLVYHRFLFDSLKHALQNVWRTLRYAFFGFLLYKIGTYLLSIVIYACMPDFFNVNDSSIAGMGSEYFGLPSVRCGEFGESINFVDNGFIFCNTLHRIDKNSVLAFI